MSGQLLQRLPDLRRRIRIWHVVFLLTLWPVSSGLPDPAGVNLQYSPVRIDFHDALETPFERTRYTLWGNAKIQQSGNFVHVDSIPKIPFVINPMITLGREAVFKIRLRRPGNGDASVTIHFPFHYVEQAPHDKLTLEFGQNRMKLRRADQNQAESRPMELSGDGWIEITIERRGDRIRISSSAAALFEYSRSFVASDFGIPEHQHYGAFSIEIKEAAASQSIDIDDIQISGLSAPVEYRAMNKAFESGGENYEFSVIYEAGFEEWAKNQVEGHPEIFPQCTATYGIPPQARFLGMVQNRGRYFYSSHGMNRFHSVVHTWAANSDRKPRSCHHEFAHNWAYVLADQWSKEGFTEIVHAEEDSLFRIVFRMPESAKGDPGKWLSGVFVGDNRFGWEEAMPTESTAKFYFKAEVFARLLFYEIGGPERFRDLHRRMLALGHRASTPEIISISSEIAGRDLTDVFRGWVTPGNGKYDPVDIGRDTDRDGLTDLEEKVWGLSSGSKDTDADGIEDFFEIRAGFNPADAASPGAANRFIVIDGSAADWKKVPGLIQRRPEKESSAVFQTLRIAGDRSSRRLYLRIDLNRSLHLTTTAGTSLWMSLNFYDASGGEYIRRVNLFFPAKSYSAVSRFGISGTADSAGSAVNLYGNVFTDWGIDPESGNEFIEAVIPDSLLGGAGEYRMSFNGGVKNGGTEQKDFFPKAPVKFEEELYTPPLPVWRFW